MGQATSSASNPSAGPNAAGPKNLQRIDLALHSFSLVGAPSNSLTTPPQICVMYGPVPDAPKDAADDAVRGGCVRGGDWPGGSSRDRVASLAIQACKQDGPKPPGANHRLSHIPTLLRR